MIGLACHPYVNSKWRCHFLLETELNTTGNVLRPNARSATATVRKVVTQ
jgi:hypothetical protein